jgi:hypothetical protein
MEDLYRAKSIKTSLLVEFVVGYTLSGNRFIEVNSLSINSEEADVLTDKNGDVLGEIQTSIQITPMNINPVAPPADDDKDFEITPELLKRLGIEAESADADYDLNK